MKKPHLVQNWKDAWRWYSMQALTFLAFLPLVWMELPPTAQEFVSGIVPPDWHPLIITVVASSGAIMRLIDQTRGEP